MRKKISTGHWRKSIKEFLFGRPQSIEERLLRNPSKYGTKVGPPSVLFFTTWKCGSVITDQIFRRLCRHLGLRPVDFQTYIEYNMDSPYQRLRDPFFLSNCFPAKGYFFGPLKFFINIPQLENYRVIIQLRDPRDLLTSMYYSFAFSHPEIHEAGSKIKDEFRNSDVNAMALKYGPQYLQHSFKPYMDLLKSNDQILFVKYEEMVTTFDTWLHKICEHLGANLSEDERAEILSIADFKVDKEDIHSHKRSVQPGNHKKHLSPDTIAKLDNIFVDVNSFYGY